MNIKTKIKDQVNFYFIFFVIFRGEGMRVVCLKCYKSQLGRDFFTDELSVFPHRKEPTQGIGPDIGTQRPDPRQAR